MPGVVPPNCCVKNKSCNSLELEAKAFNQLQERLVGRMQILVEFNLRNLGTSSFLRKVSSSLCSLTGRVDIQIQKYN